MLLTSFPCEKVCIRKPRILATLPKSPSSPPPPALPVQKNPHFCSYILPFHCTLKFRCAIIKSIREGPPLRAAKWRFSIMGLLEDARNIQRKDPAARSVLEVILLYPGFHILVYHRIAHWLFEHKHFFLARWVSQRIRPASRSTPARRSAAACSSTTAWASSSARRRRSATTAPSTTA